jgi:hypothetical protein
MNGQANRTTVASRAGNAAMAYWIPALGVVVCLSLGGLSVAAKAYSRSASSGCLTEALASLARSPLACMSNLEVTVVSAVTQLRAIEQYDWMEQILIRWSGGVPRLLLWLDNLVVDMYTLFFIAAACAAYKQLTTVKSDPLILWRAAISATCFLALLGGALDHSENFWLLARMNKAPYELPPNDPYWTQLPIVGQISVWKFRLFAVNLIVLVAWWGMVVWRTRWSAKHNYDILTLLADADEMNLRARLGLKHEHWPPEISFGDAKIGNHRAQRWQGVFFYHFLSQIDSAATFRYSFSTHAVNKWENLVSAAARVDEQTQTHSNELKRYLSYLAQQGFLTPKRGRFEITFSTLSEPLPQSAPPVTSAMSETPSTPSKDLSR